MATAIYINAIPIMIKMITGCEREVKPNVTDRSKLKFKIPGNYETTELQTMIQNIGGVETCNVIYDGECQTVGFVYLN